MSDTSPMLKAAPILEMDEKIKLAIYGNVGAGKTTFGVRIAQMFPDLKLFIALTEPFENLKAILDTYPDVKKRTVYIPNEEQMDKIREVGKWYDEQGFESGQEIALAEFLHSELLKVANRPANELKKWIIMVDTASQIAKELVNKTYDQIHKLPDGHQLKIGQKRARFAYGPAKRKFNVIAKRLFKCPTHVILTGRTEPLGEVSKVDGKVTFRWTRDEKPEWDGSAKENPSKLGYEATTIVHLHKVTKMYEDANKSHVPLDAELLPGKYHTETLRWAELKKYKAPITIAPVFFNPAPWDVFGWIKENVNNLPKSS